MNKPWWLNEDDAVKNAAGVIGQISIFKEDESGCYAWVYWAGVEYCLPYPVNSLVPISNPAIMLAPKWADRVRISNSTIIWLPSSEFPSTLTKEIYWEKCPKDLEGQLLHLPKLEI